VGSPRAGSWAGGVKHSVARGGGLAGEIAGASVSATIIGDPGVWERTAERNAVQDVVAVTRAGVIRHRRRKQQVPVRSCRGVCATRTDSAGEFFCAGSEGSRGVVRPLQVNPCR
jgi:hypothetical protein